MKWSSNSCRYDTFITLYIITFENYIKNILANGNILINSLHACSLEMIYNKESNARFLFWKEYDENKIDGEDNNISLFLKEGYISGLFSIYNHNIDFCISYSIKKNCLKCGFKLEKK